MPRVGTIDVEGIEHGAVIAVAQKARLRGYGFRAEHGTRLLVESVAGRHEAADALARIAKLLGKRLRFEPVSGIVFGRLPEFEEIEIAKRPPMRLGHVDRVDANGDIYGWAAAAPDSDCVRVRLFVDKQPIGETLANIFRLDLLKAHVGLGGHGFKFRPPARFLTGDWHEVEAEIVETGLRFGLWLQLPFHFSCPRPWLGIEPAPDWSSAEEKELQEARRAAMHGEPLDALRAIVDRKPMVLWRDLGLFERHARRGELMSSFKSRLNARDALLYGSMPCREENCCKGKPLGRDKSLIDKCPLLLRHFWYKPFVKEYATRLAIKTARTLCRITSLDDFDQFDFPERYVLKPARDSGRGIFLMHHKINLFDGLHYSRDELREVVVSYLTRHKHSDGFVVEELLRQECLDSSQPHIPLDFWMHAYGGKVRILHINDRNIESYDPRRRRRFTWAARDWSNPIAIMRPADQENDPMRRPRCFDQMLEVADRIAADLNDYVRIDMYATDSGPVLGELTTYSYAGKGFTDYGSLVLTQPWELWPDNQRV